MTVMPTGFKAMPGELSKEVAAILRAQMARHRIAQSPLAEAVGLSQGQLSGILNAKKHVDIEKLDEICQALGLEYAKVIREADEATDGRYFGPGRPRTLVQK